jgi:hypothetical protein
MGCGFLGVVIESDIDIIKGGNIMKELKLTQMTESAG